MTTVCSYQFVHKFLENYQRLRDSENSLIYYRFRLHMLTVGRGHFDMEIT